jgi:phosphoserine phosphatase RsbU/P
MNFTRETLPEDWPGSDPKALCARLAPGSWMIEAGHQPPLSHDPERFPLGEGLTGGLVLSLSSATLMGLSLGPALVDRLSALGLPLGPMAGLALHELIVNAVIHGNLRVEAGRSVDWADLAKRQATLDDALTDPSRTTRMVTIAAYWRADDVVVAIVDEGEGHDVSAPRVTKSGSGRGLRLARMVGRVDVLSGGSRTTITLKTQLPSKEGTMMLRKAPPIIVISPKLDEAHDIAGWLRGAGLGEISTVRTCDEAIFMLGRNSPDLLIIDEFISASAEQRLLRHIRANGRGDGPPLVRLIGACALDPLASGRSMAAEVISKPLLAHDVVLRVGAAMQRPDLLGRLDQSSDETARNLDAARQMQIGLLPTEDRLRSIREQCGVGVAAFYRSGEAVGGDFWDVRPTIKGRFAVALADFTGHGLSAALNTFRLQALLSDQTLPRGRPTRMTALLNERLHLLLPRGLYATMVYLHIDARRRLVAWCGAGGPPPLLVSVDRADDLETRGLPLGVRSNGMYRRRWMRLPEAGILAVFSDGLFESGGQDPDVPREATAGSLAEPAALAKRGDLAAAAQEATVRLEGLRDRYPRRGHSDDVMAICVAFGP